MILSIIQTSQSRKTELARFIRSLNCQQNIDLSKIQYIFVDQEDNKELFKCLNPLISFVYIKYHPCGLSEARNVALKKVKGDLIAFGDDDAWFDEDTLSKIFFGFKNDVEGIIAVAKNEMNILVNDGPDEECKLTYTDHKGAFSSSIFLRFDPMVTFDENIGVGSRYKLLSGEESDYLYTFMERHPNFNILYKPDIIVRHPIGEKRNFRDTDKKTYYYARGLGYVLRKHPLPLIVKLRSFIRPLGGMAIYAFVDWKKCRHSYYLLKGRLEGYFYKIKA